MKQILIFLTVSVFLVSCKTQTTEYLEFESSNAVLIGGNKTLIKLIPTTKKTLKNVNVIIFCRGNSFDNKRISKEKYDLIVDLFKKISINDSSKTIWIDAPTIKIKYRNKDFIKEFYYERTPKKDKTFYKITELILKSANLNVQNID